MCAVTDVHCPQFEHESTRALSFECSAVNQAHDDVTELPVIRKHVSCLESYHNLYTTFSNLAMYLRFTLLLLLIQIDDFTSFRKRLY